VLEGFGLVDDAMSIPPHDRLNNSQRSALDSDVILHELRALREELRTMHRLFDDFARAYLNAKFPYGKPTDRWSRRG
jgi:hypothetical protein